jgi:hypothetical protein
MFSSVQHLNGLAEDGHSMSWTGPAPRGAAFAIHASTNSDIFIRFMKLSLILVLVTIKMQLLAVGALSILLRGNLTGWIFKGERGFA